MWPFRSKQPPGTLYAVCDVDGEEVHVPWLGVDYRRFNTLDEAVTEAVARLEDDPEAREFTVWRIHPSGNLVTHLKTVTHGPDANWDTVVVVLEPGEHVQAPGPVPHRISEDDLDGYDLDDPKRWALQDRIGEWTP